MELVKSEKQGNGSYMLVHLGKAYCFDWYKELVNQYNLAIHYVRRTSTQFAIVISDYGRPIKRPHIAFERDLIAHFIASTHTAEIKIQGEKPEPEDGGSEDVRAWIDSSNGAGELETTGDNYAFNYLMMSDNINSIHENVEIIRRELSGYSSYSDPILTHNN